jgi:hypothetical protein
MYLDSNGDAQVHRDWDFPDENFELYINRRNRVVLNRTMPPLIDSPWQSQREIYFEDDNYYME